MILEAIYQTGVGLATISTDSMTNYTTNGTTDWIEFVDTNTTVTSDTSHRVYKVVGTPTWQSVYCNETGDDDWYYRCHKPNFNVRFTRCDWETFKVERVQKPIQRLQQIIQERIAPKIHVRNSLSPAKDPREMAARRTLQRVLGDEKYRAYLKQGHVSVRGKSGLVYQLFPGHGITNVYQNGKKVDRLCVVLKGDFPPTDSLIMRYLLILNDEADFRQYAIRHTVSAPKERIIVPDRSLVEILKELRAA